MLYVVIWSFGPDSRDTIQDRFKETRGAPPAGVEMLGRWHDVAGNRGMCIAKSDDPVAVAKWTQEWSDLLEFEIFPALDDDGYMRMLG